MLYYIKNQKHFKTILCIYSLPCLYCFLYMCMYIIYIYMSIYIYICIYIYTYGTPPRPTFQANLVVFKVFFWTFWTPKLRAFFGDPKLHVFAIVFPSHPSRSTSDPRFKIPQKNLESKGVGFKIQDPKKTSWIQGGRIQDSRSPKNFLNPRG